MLTPPLTRSRSEGVTSSNVSSSSSSSRWKRLASAAKSFGRIFADSMTATGSGGGVVLYDGSNNTSTAVPNFGEEVEDDGFGASAVLPSSASAHSNQVDTRDAQTRRRRHEHEATERALHTQPHELHRQYSTVSSLRGGVLKNEAAAGGEVEVEASHVRFHDEESQEPVKAIELANLASPKADVSRPSSPPLSTVIDLKTTGDVAIDSILQFASGALKSIQSGGQVQRSNKSFPEMIDGLTVEQVKMLVQELTPAHLAALRDASSSTDGFVEDQFLTFSNMGYWEKDPTTNKPVDLVRWVSGYLAPRQICCVLGSPDSGVTPLLDLICGRASHADGASGTVLLNGLPPAKDFKQTLGYVTKNEAQFAQMTVYETLVFSARLRSDNPNEAFMQFRIFWILKLLNLSHTADTIVGDALMRGLSGGEKRRLWFACEAVAQHRVLVADLPTNGLDAPSALSLFQHLRFFADQFGMSVISSMTQASPEILSLCDTVLLMCKGSCIYFGPVSKVESHLAAQGFPRPKTISTLPGYLEFLSAQPERFWVNRHIPIQPRLSPLEYHRIIMETLTAASVETKDQIIDGLKRKHQEAVDRMIGPYHGNGVRKLTSGASSMTLETIPNSFQAWHRLYEGYQQSPFYEDVVYTEQRQKMLVARKQEAAALNNLKREMSAVTHYGVTLKDKPDGDGANEDHREAKTYKYRSSFFLQFWLCTKRETLLTYRNKGLWLGNWIKAVLMALVVGSLFWDVGTNQASIRTRMGLLYFIISFIIAGAVQLISVLNSERNVLYHQTASGYYSNLAYYAAMTVVQIPLGAIETFLFIVIVYPLAGLTNGVGSTEFLYAFLVLWLCNLVGRSWAFFGTALSPNQAGSQAIVMLITLLSSFFCGYLSPKSLIPIGWRWLYTISFITYTLRGFAVSQFNAIPVMDCSDAVNPENCPYPTGNAALQQYDMQDSTGSEWDYLLNVFWFWLAINVATCAALTFLDFRARTKFEPPSFFSPQLLANMQKQKEQGMNQLPAGNQPKQLTDDSSPVAAAVKPEPVDDDAIGAAIEASNDARFARLQSIPSRLQGKERVFAFRHVNFEIDVPASKKAPASKRKLLKGCFGYAKTNQLLALMGPSGAGKTTLLDVLAQMKTQGRTSCDLMLDGKPVDDTVQIGYVEQFDSHNELATVREAILFSAHLRRPELSESEVHETVDELLELLGLTHLANERIGNPQVDGVSPEVRKKVTIGVELVKNPDLLFADEATTGLDNVGAIEIMKVLKKLSQRMIVIATVHQPAIEIVNMFDSLLLCVAGEVAYFGPMSNLLPYMSENGFGEMPASQHNVADFAMTAINSSIKAGRKPVDIYAQSASSQQVRSELDELFSEQDAKLPSGLTSKEASESRTWKMIKLRTVASFPAQLKHVTKRALVTTLRDTPALGSRIFTTVFISFLVGTLFYQLRADQLGAQSFFSVVYMMCIFSTMSAVVKLPEQFTSRPVYFRETTSAMYSPSVYFWARFIVDIPFVIVEVLILLIMIYFLSGLSGNFGTFLALLFGARITALNLVYIICSVSSTIELANSFVSVVVTIANLFSGFLIAKAAIPGPWEWMYYLSYLRYPLTAAAQNELGSHSSFECETSELFSISLSQNEVVCPTTPGQTLRCPLMCGDDLLTTLGLSTSDQDMAQNVGITYVFAAGFGVFALIALKYVNFIRR